MLLTPRRVAAGEFDGEDRRERLYLALCAEHGVDHDSPFARKMYAMAYDRGHRVGVLEVADGFMELLPLWAAHAEEVRGGR